MNILNIAQSLRMFTNVLRYVQQCQQMLSPIFVEIPALQLQFWREQLATFLNSVQKCLAMFIRFLSQISNIGEVKLSETYVNFLWSVHRCHELFPFLFCKSPRWLMVETFPNFSELFSFEIMFVPSSPRHREIPFGFN